MSYNTFKLFVPFAVLMAAAAVAAGQTRAAEMPRIRAIEVVSMAGERMTDSFVMTQVASREGAALDPDLVAGDVRALLDSGRFAYVGSRVVETADNGVRLLYVVERRLLVMGEVTFTGEGYWRTSKVREAYGLKPGSFVDAQVIATAEARVAKWYRDNRQRPNTQVTTTVTPVGAGGANLAVTVTQGAVMETAMIQFTGNTGINARSLRRHSNQTPWWSLTGLFSGKERVTDFDLEIIKSDMMRQYHDKGMLDAQITGPVKTNDNSRILIRYDIEEGIVYKVGAVEIKDATVFPVESLLAAARLRRGDIAGAGAIENARAAIEAYFTSRGYVETRVTTFFYADAENEGVLNIVFSVMESGLAKIGNILIRGNTVTKDKVIRREISLNPGDIYDGVAADLSRRRLQNLGYFENVRSYDIKSRDAEDGADGDLRDLVFDLDETSTGSMMFGAGFSSVDKVLGFFEISQSNFDIFNPGGMFRGGGQKARLNMSVSSKSTDIEANWTEPWFLDRRLALDIGAFVKNRSSYSGFDERRVGGSVGLSRFVPWVGRVGLNYTLQKVNLYNVLEGDFYPLHGYPDEIYRYTDEEDSYLLGSMRASWTYDTRDRMMIPTSGTRATFAATLNNGAFGSDIDFYELDFRVRHYVPLWYGHVIAFNAHAAVTEGMNGDDVPIGSRYFMGGGKIARGFGRHEIGPKALRELGGRSYNSIGGRSTFDASAEYTIPVFSALRLAAFYDVGNVYNDPYDFDFSNYASSVGGGLRLDIPGFPIRLDYAHGLTKDDDYTRKRAFVFWIGFE